MVDRFKQSRDANEFTQSQAGGVSSLRKAKGVPNQNKSNPGVSGRPLGPPRQQPPPPPGGQNSISIASKGALPEPPRVRGGGGGELPINTAARVRGQRGEVPPEKVAQSNEDAVDGKPGRTKKDDVKIGAATPLPPPPPGKDGEAGTPTPEQKELQARRDSALETGAPIDPATGLPQKPDFDGSFTDEEGNALNPDGTAVVDPETGAPLTPEQALTEQIKSETGATSNFMAEKQAREEKETLRRASPSEIPGVNTGHFEDIADPKRFENYGGKPTSPMLAEKLQENVRQQLQEFGTFPGSDDPNAPAPPIREGGRSFNPFTGKFTGENGPNSFQMKGFDMEAAKRDFYKQGGSAELPKASGEGGVTAKDLTDG